MYVDSRGALARSQTYDVRRRETRYVSSMTATLQRFLRFGPIITRGVTLDISMGGMSALVCGAPRVGETVVIGLSLPDANIEMLASVRHSSDARSGFEFYPLSLIARTGNSELDTGTAPARRNAVPLSVRVWGQVWQRLRVRTYFVSW